MQEFERLCLTARAVTVFKNVTQDKTISSFIKLLGCPDGDEAEFTELYSAFAASLYNSGEDLTGYICRRILEDENIYVRSAAKKAVSPLIKAAAEHELEFFVQLAAIKSDDLKKHISSDIYLPGWTNDELDITAAYNNKIANICTTGYGMYSEHRMFLLKNGEIVPVRCPDPQRLSQLSGYEEERQKVIDNTLALINGRPCNNVLLYGDAGSGKSSTVKAVVNEFWNKGLRLLEIKKNQLYSLPEVLEKLSDNPLKFIIFIDDLSFSSGDSDFGALKAVLEGGAASKTGNVAIYATSNRRNLVRESFGERDGDDIHVQDTIQEIMSLSARFGLKITFSRPNKDLYLSIAENLSIQYNIDIDKDELYRSAEAFALRNGGRSPRTAKQFIEYLASKEN